MSQTVYYCCVVSVVIRAVYSFWHSVVSVVKVITAAAVNLVSLEKKEQKAQIRNLLKTYGLYTSERKSFVFYSQH